jgi:hypothetical protein
MCVWFVVVLSLCVSRIPRCPMLALCLGCFPIDLVPLTGFGVLSLYYCNVCLYISYHHGVYASYVCIYFYVCVL